MAKLVIELEAKNVLKTVTKIDKSMAGLGTGAEKANTSTKKLSSSLAAVARNAKFFADAQSRLKQGSYQAQINRETAALDKHAKQVARAKANSDRFAKARASLKQGSYQAQINRETKALEKQGRVLRGIQKIRKGMLGVGGLVSGVGVAYGATQLIQISDAYTNIDSKLKLVAKDSLELAKIQQDLLDISQETGTEYKKNANALGKLGLALKSQSVPAQELLDISELLNKSLVVSGASTVEASSFMLQYTQALSSGVLAGEEYRAMTESNAYFATQLADALGITRGELKQMSKDQLLTTDVLRDAMRKMSEQVDSDFSEMTKTVSRAVIELKNAFEQIVNEANKGSGATESLAENLSDFATAILQNKDEILGFVSAIIEGIIRFGGLVGTVFYAAETVIAGFGVALVGILKPWAYLSDAVGFTENAVGELEMAMEGFKGSMADFGGKTAGAFDVLINGLETTKEEAEKVAAPIQNIGTEVEKSMEVASKATAKDLKKMKSDWQKYTDDVDGDISSLTDKIKSLNGEIAEDQRSLTSKLRAIGREGMTDSQAYNDTLAEIRQLHKLADEAGRAGGEGLEKQLDMYKEIESLVSGLSSKAIKADLVSDEDVKRAKEVFESLRKAGASTSLKGDALFKAKKDYEDLLKAQRQGGQDLLSQEDALRNKKNLTKQVAEAMLENKNKQVIALEEERKILEENRLELEAYQKKMQEELKRTSKNGNQLADSLIEVNHQFGAWTTDAVTDVNRVTDAVQELNSELAEAGGASINVGGSYEHRATGGSVNSGQPYIVGERGQELFVPTQAGTIVPNNELRNDTVDLNISMGGNIIPLSGSRQSVDTFVSEMEKMQRLAS